MPQKTTSHSAPTSPTATLSRQDKRISALSDESTRARPSSNVSTLSLRHTSVEVCYCVYGETPDAVDAVERFYEDQALYENPLLTATSRSTIRDIFALSRSLGVVDVPTPLVLLHRILHLRPPSSRQEREWFGAMRVWTEIGDISDSESFDGQRKCVVEHSLNFLFLPDLHTDDHHPSDSKFPNPSSPSLHSFSRSPSQSQAQSAVFLVNARPHPISPCLPLPGTSIFLPSPFHFTLNVTSKLTFNEQGKVSYHRDYWDLKDLVGLVPGMGLVQWVVNRMVARGLGWFSRRWVQGVDDTNDSDKNRLKDMLGEP